jgi:hypothetical protein
MVKKVKRKTLTTYLDKYTKIQEDILLCSRISNEGEGSGWGDRCIYLDDNYSAKKHYNHRITLDKEVVIEFDEEDKKKNKDMANIVTERLQQDNIPYSMWFSGSKSYHVHFFIDPRQATNIRLLKSCIIRHYCRDLEFKPDLQMAGQHLIRAEYGLNEKTGNKKTIIQEREEYPKVCPVSEEAWELYIHDMRWIMKRSMNKTIKDISNSEEVKKLLDTTYFNDTLKDGRTRILFVLANVLKGKYEKKELIDLLQKWYKYTNGRKLTYGQIAYQVHSAYRSDKAPGLSYIMQLMRELGVE